MKLKSMTATFGRLEGARLNFGPGLNVIHGPNEGGKSTWCAFWRAMLYGVDTRDRDKKGHLADKNRYQPWSGAPMMGEITLEWQGRDITIRRGPRGNTPFGAFSAVYTGTQEPVPGLTADTCGERLTGVGREVFERSAFLGGGALTVTAAPELEKRIAALVSSGQEDVSYSQTQGALKEWLNRRKVNRSVGLIPKLEEELAQVTALLDRLNQITADIARLEGEVTRLDREYQSYAQEARLHRQLANQELDRRCEEARQELAQAQARLQALEQESTRFGALPDRERLKRAQGELQYLKVLDEEIVSAQRALQEAEDRYVAVQRAIQDTPFASLSFEEAQSRVNKELAEYASCVETCRMKRASAKLFPILGLILGVGFGAAQLILNGTLVGQNLYVGGFLLVVCALVGYLNHTNAREWARKGQSILARCQVARPEELEAQLAAYQQLCQQAQSAAGELKTLRGALNEKLARRDNGRTDLLHFVHTFAPEVTALFGCSAALSRALNWEHELAMARERVAQCARRREDLALQGGQTGQEPPLQRPAHSQGQCALMLDHLRQKLAEEKAQLDQARGALASMGDPAELTARREELEEALARRRQEYEAISLACDVLREASGQLQTRFSPELNRLAGDYLAQLTGQRYTGLTLSRELEGEILRPGDVLPRSALYLSRGTVDQLYLAVRLAVCQLCLPQKPPLVLDDALTAFDDERLRLALDLLGELAQAQQVLLFTCQQREGSLLAQTDGVTALELG